MKIIRSQAGFTITELMVVIAISGFLMAAAATGFSAFFAKFDELNKTMELQRDAFNCMQTIKNGIKIGSGLNLRFQGIATADSVIFLGAQSNTSQSIILYPPPSDYTHQNDFIRIYWDGRYVRETHLYGSVQAPSAEYLFPKPVRGNETYVTELTFSKANPDGNVAKVIKVDLKAKTLIRKINKKPIYQTISYSTRMTLSMR